MTSPQWLSHFGLQEPPFTKDLCDTDLWLPSSKKSLVDQLVEAIDERQHVLLTGEPGVGKTCTLRALRRRLPEAGYRLTYFHNATLGRRDFYRQLCLALSLSPKATATATAAAVFFAISSHVEELGREHIHPVFLLDESHSIACALPPRMPCLATVTKGAGNRTKALTMAFKLLDMAQKRWRKLTAPHLMPLVAAGVSFVDGVQPPTQDQESRRDAA